MTTKSSVEPQQETDVRVQILDSLITCPHKDVSDLIELHKKMEDQDQIFYAHLGVWSQANTAVKDHKELFIAQMFLSDIPEHREAAYVLLQAFPPYQINRIINHIKGSVKITKDGKVYEKRFGRNLPRIFRTALVEYLRNRESNRDWFDNCVLTDHKAMKSLYCRGKVSPGNDHVRAVLFEEGEVNPESRYGKFKQFVKEEDPSKQAEMIVTNDLPFMKSIGAIKKMTPSVFVALINAMTPSQILANLNSMKKKGAFDNPEVKSLIDKKLKEAKSSKKVDALKAAQAAEHVEGLDEETREEIKKVTDERLKDFTISRPTALLIDKSGSMETAIEVAKEIGAMISARVESNFYCYAFDRNAFNISCKSPNRSDWERAMKGIKADGGTSIGASVEVMIRNNEKVEQFVIVSDFDERNSPFFESVYNKYVEKFNTRPSVIMVNVKGKFSNGKEVFGQKLKQLKIEFDVFSIEDNADYYSLPNLLVFLTRPSKFDLIQEIIETPLPTRE